MPFGTVLNSPESGWIRYDSEDKAITYEGTWITDTNVNYYNNSRKTTSYRILTNKIKFNFNGPSIRIISSLYIGYSNSLIIKIDGIEYFFSQANNGTLNRAVCFEKTDLMDREHFVEIIKIKNGSYSIDFNIDAIDIKEGKELKPYNENLNNVLLKINNQYKYFENNKIKDLPSIEINKNAFISYGSSIAPELIKELNKIEGSKQILFFNTVEQLNLKIFKTPEIEIIKQLDEITVNKNELKSINFKTSDLKNRVFFAVQFPDVDSENYYVYKNAEWNVIDITNKALFIETANEINDISLLDWSKSRLNQKLRFIYMVILSNSNEIFELESILITTNNNVMSTPIINTITAKTKNFSLKGYMEKVEAKNERDFVELVFKSDTALDAKKNKMESLIVDVFNEDSVENISTKADIKETMIFVKDLDIAEGFLKSITIDSLENIKGVEV